MLNHFKIWQLLFIYFFFWVLTKNYFLGDRVDLRSNFNCDVAAKLFCPGATVACALCGLLE